MQEGGVIPGGADATSTTSAAPEAASGGVSPEGVARRTGVPPQRLDRWVLAVVAIGTLARCAYLAGAPMAEAIYRLTDDAYYYFNVARNFTQGFGLSFDRINPSNGFHPLWMACLLPVYALAGQDADLALRLVQCLVAAVAGLTLLAAYRTLTLYVSRATALLCTLALLAPPYLNLLLNGLETGLLLLLLFVTFHAVERWDLLASRAGAIRDLLFGLLLALVFLCRLDSAFLILALLAACVVRALGGPAGPAGRSWGSLLGKLARVGMAAVPLAGGYLAWNLLSFGHAVPISGALKTSFPTITFTPSRLTEPHTLFGTLQILVSGLGLLWLWARPRPGESERRAVPLLAVLWCGAFAHFLNTVLFMDWAAHWWHFGAYAPLTILVLALVLDRLLATLRQPRLGFRLAAAGVLASAAVAYVSDLVVKGEHHAPWYEAALWARRNLPPDAVVGMTDCGVFGYFCERRTVNLDGVINGYAYQDALRDHRLGEYLRSCGVTHVADYRAFYRSGWYVLPLPARLYDRPGGAIVATPEGEVFRSEPYPSFLRSRRIQHFAIWDLKQARVLDDRSQLSAAYQVFLRTGRLDGIR
jgi:hypothetical protein